MSLINEALKKAQRLRSEDAPDASSPAHTGGNLPLRRGKSDGPVSVNSTKLAGVDDHVVIACDHASLYYPANGKKPAAWEAIRRRLAQ